MNAQVAANRIARLRITTDADYAHEGIPPLSRFDYTPGEWQERLQSRLTLAFVDGLDADLLEAFTAEALAAYMAACDRQETRVDVGVAA